MAEKVVVTGLGTISAIGNNIAETLDSLKSKRAGISHIDFINTIHKGTIPVGEIKHSNSELAEMANVAFDKTLSRTILLSIIAGREAMKMAGINQSLDTRVGLTSATSVGGMDRYELFFADLMEEDVEPELEEVMEHDCGYCTHQLANALGITGYMATVSTACSSSANSIMLAARLIKAGKIDKAVAGGTDALAKFTINGFNTLMILDREPCKPFDQNRKGLNLGEGAGYLVLESEKSAKQRGAKILGEVSGYGNANDAFHQTASSPDGTGAYLAMKKALEIAKLEPQQISYINAHGTGTANNDESESIAIEKIFGDNIPPVSSTKAYTGHTLGAAGGVEAVLSLLAIQEGLIYPNLRIETPMEGRKFKPITDLKEDQNIEHIVSNSFGFGGNTSSVIFSKCK